MSGTRLSDDWRIPDALWAEIEWLLPEHRNTHRFGGGRRVQFLQSLKKPEVLSVS